MTIQSNSAHALAWSPVRRLCPRPRQYLFSSWSVSPLCSSVSLGVHIYPCTYAPRAPLPFSETARPRPHPFKITPRPAVPKPPRSLLPGRQDKLPDEPHLHHSPNDPCKSWLAASGQRLRQDAEPWFTAAGAIHESCRGVPGACTLASSLKLFARPVRSRSSTSTTFRSSCDSHSAPPPFSRHSP